MKLLLMLALLLNGAQQWYDDYTEQMPHKTVRVIKMYAEGFSLSRSAEIQAALLDEDLVWQRLGLSKEQRTLVVAIALGMALDRAEEEIKKIQADGVKGDAAKTLAFLLRFRSEAERVLERHKETLAEHDWTTGDFRFFLREPGGKPQ